MPSTDRRNYRGPTYAQAARNAPMTTDREEQLNAALRAATLDSIASSLDVLANKLAAERARGAWEGDMLATEVSQFAIDNIRKAAGQVARLPRPEVEK